MKVNRRNIILMLCMIFTGCVAFTVAHTFGQKYAQSADWVGFEEKYFIGQTLDIPENTIEYEGVSYKTIGIVYTPDGHAFETKSVFLDQIGTYTVEYRAVGSDVLQSEKYSFKTIDKTFSFSGDKSTAVYGLDDSVYQTGITGLNISLAKDEVFYYNDVIDLKKLGSERDVIKLFMTPSVNLGDRDVSRIVFQMQDVNDPDNCVKISVQAIDSDGGGNPWWLNTSYMKAAAPNQTYTGIEWGPPQKIHMGGQFGFPVNYSMYGYTDFQNSVGKEFLSFKMDLDENCIYGPEGKVGNYIVDLDSSKYFANLWKGFSTGEVYLSFWGEDYANDTMKLTVTNIGQSDISGEILEDKTPPEISVDYAGFDSANLPDAAKGKVYPVFAASAKDTYSKNVEIVTRVFCNYNANTRYELPVVNGTFTPSETGLYTVEYTATDYSGNTAVKIVNINCGDSSGDLVLSVTAGPVDGVVGEYISVGTASFTGGIGKLALDIKVSNQETVCQINNNAFRPMSTGEYKIEYFLSDQIGQSATYAYRVVVGANPASVFLNPVVLPKYFIAGAEYVLPEMRAYNFNASAEIESTINATNATGSNRRFSFAKGSGNTVVTYTASYEGTSVQKIYTVPVIDAISDGSIDMAAYFVTENLTATAHNDSVELKNRNTVAKTAFEFAQPMLTEELSVSLTIDSSANDFKSLDLYLTDYSDSLVFLKLRLVKGLESSSYGLVYVNDKPNATRVNAFFYNDSQMTVKYDNKTKMLMINSVSLPVPTDFSGFGSEGVYLRGELNDVTGNSAIKISAINAQALSSQTTDETAPKISVSGHYAATYAMGKNLTVFRAFCFDVLSPYVTGLVTVLAPDGRAARLPDGSALLNLPSNKEYSVELTQLGQYTVRYTAEDASFNQFSYSIRINTRDSQKPEIALIGSNPVTAVLGEEIIFSKATATDDIDTAVKVHYYIVSPEGMISSVWLLYTSQTDDTIGFKVEKDGIYIIRYFAVDKSGNICIYDHAVKVFR